MSAIIRSLDVTAWGRVLLAWLALAVAMSLNGVFRELALRPTLGPRAAAVVSAALGVVFILLVTRALLPPLVDCDTAVLVQVCVALFVLTVAFETALGLVVDHKSWRALVDHYALWRGELWPIVLAVLTVTPFIWGRWWPVE
jgi:hypothetical protein